MDITIKFTALYKNTAAFVSWNLSQNKVTIDGKYDFRPDKVYSLPVMKMTRQQEDKLKQHNLELKCFGNQKRIVKASGLGIMDKESK